MNQKTQPEKLNSTIAVLVSFQPSAVQYYKHKQKKKNRRSSGNHNYTVIIILQEDFLQRVLSLWSAWNMSW